MTTNAQPVGSFERSSSQTGVANLLRRGLALVLAYLMIPIGIGDVYAQSYGQQAPPPPPPDQQQQYNQPYGQQQYGQQGNQPYGQQYDQQYGQPYGQANYNQPLTPDELDQLVAPVALYPDALLAQVLAASTYPTQVVDADRWVQSYGNYPPYQMAEMVNGMPWDPSVKSLTAFPSVLDNLAQNLDWTTQLGNAYYNQPQDVMEAVQAMRQQAYDSGYLRSTPQLYVNYSPSYIEIEPANPNVVYVPYYDPWNVYGPVIHPWYRYYAPRPHGVFYGGLAIGFGVGVAVIAFSHWGWGWGHWRPDWRRREIYHGRDRYISRSRSVFNRGHFGDFDRHYGRTEFRRDHNGHARGYDRQREQFHGRPNGNFHPAPQYRQNENRNQRNFNQRQPFQNRQNYQQRQPEQNRNFNRGQQNFHRPTQRFENRPQRQPNRNQGNFNRGEQTIHHAPQNFGRPPQRFEGQPRRSFNHTQPRQNGNPRSFHRSVPPQNRGGQGRGRQNNRPQNHSRPEHPQHHGNGHGRH